MLLHLLILIAMKKNLGEEHDETLIATMILTATYLKAGVCKEAIGITENVIKVQKKQPPSNYPDLRQQEYYLETLLSRILNRVMLNRYANVEQLCEFEYSCE